MLGSSQLIGRPLPLNAEGAPFFRPFGHHCQLLIWLAAGIVVQPLDLTRVALHGNIIETADGQAPARVRCCDKTSLCKKRATPVSFGALAGVWMYPAQLTFPSHQN